MFNRVEKTDVERMWNMFATCLELLHLDLLKSLNLLRSFPMHSGKVVFSPDRRCLEIGSVLSKCNYVTPSEGLGKQFLGTFF